MVYYCLGVTTVQEITQTGIARMDEDLLSHLKLAMEEPTFVIVVGDHGVHFGPYSQTVHGLYDDRNPIMIMIAPKMHLVHSHARALLANRQQLVTVFDVFETLKDVPYLSCSESSPECQCMRAAHTGSARSLFHE